MIENRLLVLFPFSVFRYVSLFQALNFQLWFFAFDFCFWMKFRVNASDCLCSWLKTFPSAFRLLLLPGLLFVFAFHLCDLHVSSSVSD